VSGSVSGRARVVSTGASFGIEFAWILANQFAGRIHGDIDVFKDLARSDALKAVGGLDDVVAFLSGVFAAQWIGEGERGVELNGPDEEAGAVGFPIVNETAHDTFQSGTWPWAWGLWFSALSAGFSVAKFGGHRLGATRSKSCVKVGRLYAWGRRGSIP